jgi:predicted site-specific integrase-resolvase
MSIEDGYLLKSEVAERCRKKPRTIERWMRTGIIPYIKLGKGRRATVLFKWAEVEKSLQRAFGIGGAN